MPPRPDRGAASKIWTSKLCDIACLCEKHQELYSVDAVWTLNSRGR